MKVITQEALRSWLDRLANKVTLIAPRTLTPDPSPVNGRGEIVLYKPVAGSGDIVFDYTRPKMSAKEAVFPSTQRILSIEKHGQDVALSEPAPDNPQVIFGLRPCDAHGIAVMDAVFMGKAPVDSTYARRREATTLVGLACPQMWEGCFCTSMGGAPDDPIHVDVLLTATKDGYAVNAVTDKGKALIASLELKELAGSVSPVTTGGIEGGPLPPDHWPERFTDRYWDLLADRCIGCRICAYVCPTCRCFDVRDEVVERRTNHAQYERLRCWDSCTGANYRVVAGGHNPRATKGQRLRNRFFCKFYYMQQDYGSTGCVGCGRCIEACPVNIDIVEMLHDVVETERQDDKVTG